MYQAMLLVLQVSVQVCLNCPEKGIQYVRLRQCTQLLLCALLEVYANYTSQSPGTVGVFPWRLACNVLHSWDVQCGPGDRQGIVTMGLMFVGLPALLLPMP